MIRYCISTMLVTLILMTAGSTSAQDGDLMAEDDLVAPDGASEAHELVAEDDLVAPGEASEENELVAEDDLVAPEDERDLVAEDGLTRGGDAEDSDLVAEDGLTRDSGDDEDDASLGHLATDDDLAERNAADGRDRQNVLINGQRQTRVESTPQGIVLPERELAVPLSEEEAERQELLNAEEMELPPDAFDHREEGERRMGEAQVDPPDARLEAPRTVCLLDIDRCRTACDAGDYDMCYTLAHFYIEGQQVPQNETVARGLLGRLCVEGHIQSCWAVGLMEETGSGGPRDLISARVNYTRACIEGVAQACEDLGYLYAQGSGSARDLRQASRRFSQACERGESHGCYALGVLHELDVLNDADAGAARALYTQACDSGLGDGCDALNARAQGRSTLIERADELHRRDGWGRRPPADLLRSER